MLWKLWLYTNYDCNLRCFYCVAKSGPNAPGLDHVKRFVDEPVELEFDHDFFTLIESEPTRLQDLMKRLPDMELEGPVIKQIHTVTNRYEFIAFEEVPDLQALGD